jgi:hypothetical protein
MEPDDEKPGSLCCLRVGYDPSTSTVRRTDIAPLEAGYSIFGL